MKNTKLKLSIIAVAVVLLGAGAVSSVRASQGFWDSVTNRVAEIVAGKIETPTDSDASPDKVFGALTSPDIQSPYLSVNGNTTYNLVQSFIDASTTIVSIPDPFLTPTSSASDVVLFTDDSGKKFTGATSTVDLARLDITGPATTSYYVLCGPSTAPTVAAPAINLVSSTIGTRVPTSTTGVIENNVSAAQGALSDGGTVAKVMLSPTNPYLNCVVQPSVSAAFTNPQNTFDGKITIKVNKTR